MEETVTIEGRCEGYKQGAIFKLTNGQTWKQTSYEYVYQYQYRPDAELDIWGHRAPQDSWDARLGRRDASRVTRGFVSYGCRNTLAVAMARVVMRRPQSLPVGVAVSGMRTLGQLPGSEGVVRRAWAMHHELGKLSETICPQAEVTEPDVAILRGVGFGT